MIWHVLMMLPCTREPTRESAGAVLCLYRCLVVFLLSHGWAVRNLMLD